MSDDAPNERADPVRTGDARDLAVGEVFGNGYRIVRRSKAGGMGAIYEVIHLGTRRRRALKVLLPQLVADDAQRERFTREATVTADVKSEHLVEVFDAGIDAATSMPYLVMELLEGEDLGEILAKRGRLPHAEVVELLAQAARALDRTHAAGVVHRDLKPSNVFVSRRDDGSPWVKLLDFGIAKIALFGAEGATNTSALGTPLYMAPEQVRANRRLGPAADRYALAQLAYRMLVGAAYWDEERRGADSVMELLVIISRGAREPASQRAERRGVTLPAAFDAWFAKAAAPKPQGRYEDAATMIADLAVALGEAMPVSRSLAPPDPRRGAREGDPTIDTTGPSAEQPSPSRISSSRSLPTPVSSTLASGAPPPRSDRSAPQESPSERTPGKRDLTPSAEPLPTPAPVTSARRGSRALYTAVAVALAGLAVFGFARNRGASHVEAPSTAPTALTDLPSPASTNAAAVAAYRAGLQEARDGAFGLLGFQRALALDPTLAEAHLQLSVQGIYDVDDAVREHFRQAYLRRTSLSPRDRELLETIEPLVARQPSDWAEASRRAARATERFPGDAQLWMVRGYVAYGESSESAHEHSARAVAIDPGYGDALSNDAEALAYLGRLDEANARLERCAEVTGSSYSSCTFIKLEIEAQQGSCAEMEAGARRAIAGGGRLDEAYEYLARALAARGAPADAVREALYSGARAFAALSGGQGSAPVPAEKIRQIELNGDVRLALLRGDFVSAERDTRALLDLIVPERREDEHGVPTQWLAQALAESGRADDAARVARAFLDKSEAWEPDPRAEDYAMARDRTVPILALARAGGALTREQAFARRDAWLAKWSARALPSFHRFLWMHAFPPLADTPAEARDALAAEARFGPLPAYRPKVLTTADIGRLHLLAGHADDAIRFLEDATKSCRALEHPVLHTRAHDWLGRAREEKGDKAGACAAYRVVIERWGAANPRSVTAEHARERGKALGCTGI
jgi:serine/threonine-protein kinase